MELPSWHTTASPWVAGVLAVVAGVKFAGEHLGAADGSDQHAGECCAQDKAKQS